MDESPVDRFVSILAQVDQAMASMPIFAKMSKGWFDAFIEQGFTEQQALYLTSRQMRPDPEQPE